jgi:hypothetical protein
MDYSPLFYRFAKVGIFLVVAFLIGLTVLTVPLTPHVDETFFFAEDDPQLREDRKIHKIFPKQDQIIINVEGPISSPAYLSKLERLTDRLLKIPQVVTGKSLTHGPKDFNDALTSEFWGGLSFLKTESHPISLSFSLVILARPPFLRLRQWWRNPQPRIFSRSLPAFRI